jgi:hypothetical protein
MSDCSRDARSASSREFTPEVKSLEQRLLLSSASSDPKKEKITGFAVQTGPVLSVTCIRRQGNTMEVTDLGPGEITVAWNGGPPHSFTGVTTTNFLAENARHDQWTFDLISATKKGVASVGGPAFRDPGPSTGSAGIELGPRRPADLIIAHADGHSLRHKAPFTATQVGSEIFVGIYTAGLNNKAVQLTNLGGGVVDENVGGTSPQIFTGIQTIVVDGNDLKKCEVTFIDDEGPKED